MAKKMSFGLGTIFSLIVVLIIILLSLIVLLLGYLKLRPFLKKKRGYVDAEFKVVK